MTRFAGSTHGRMAPTPFETIFTTMWWCVVTMTTVGYGDLYPTTPVGQIIATITMFWGLFASSG